MLSPMGNPIYINGDTLYAVDPEKIIDGTYIVPPTVKYIHPHAFDGADKLTHIEIPDTVKRIESSAFANCKNLKSVKLPKELKSIPMNLFENCVSLEEVKLPEEARYFGAYVFKNCSSLKTVNLPKNIPEIPAFTFKGCSSLETIELPKTVESILNSAFKGCTSLKNVIGSENIKRICNDSFLGCESLSEINFTNNLIEIGERAFKDCKSLKNFTFPRGLTKLNTGTFENCSSLENFTFSGNIRVIDSFAFKNCSSLKSIKLPDYLYGIGSFAFAGCSALESINAPNYLREINHSAFKGCSSLKSFKISPLVTAIENETFANCTSLESIDIPKSIWGIGYDAFTNCDSLTSLKIPSSVKNMPPSTSKSFKYFTKTDEGFTLESQPSENSIPLDKINLNFAFLSNNWENKDILIKEQKNPLYADFYNVFLHAVNKEDAKKFIENHNFSMFKQLNIDLEDYNLNVYGFLYNIGAFEPPYEENGKTINYAQKTVNFLINKLNKLDMTIYDLVESFEDMYALGFNKDFTDFFMENFDQLLAEENKESGFITNCYNNFEEVQKTNTSNHGSQRKLKPTVEKFRLYFAQDKFNGVTDENIHIANTISPYFNTQNAFDNAITIDKKRIKKRIPNNILHNPVNETNVFDSINGLSDAISKTSAEVLENLALTADNEFTFEWLEKNDPENFILGKLCSCCAHLEGVGYSIMHASIIHPYIQNLVIRDNSGEIVAKSTLYINHKKGYGVCNNVEVNADVKAVDYDKIYAKFIMGINAFANEYNKEHKFRKLKQINIGMNLNDLEFQIKGNNKKAVTLLNPINYSRYGRPGHAYNGDSFNEQYVIWKNDDNLFLDLNVDNLEK